jgi:hypothetical protein
MRRFSELDPDQYHAIVLASACVEDDRQRARLACTVTCMRKMIGPIQKPLYADRIQDIVDYLKEPGYKTYELYNDKHHGLRFTKTNGKIYARIFNATTTFHLFWLKRVKTLKRHLYSYVDKEFYLGDDPTLLVIGDMLACKDMVICKDDEIVIM